MNMLFRGMVLFFTVFLSFPATGLPVNSHKPLPPLEIGITPVQSGVTSNQIKPGDVIDFKITAVSLIDVQEMRIQVELTGGAGLVSGNLSWSGPANKSEEKTMILTVRAPEKGQGRIKVRASLPSPGHARLSAEADFLLGPEAEEKYEQRPLKKKSGKDRDIIEYR